MKAYGLKVKFESAGFFYVIFERTLLSKTSEKIIEIIKTNPEISAEKLSQEIGISSRAIEMQLSKLKESGRIKRVGSDKGGHWEILE